MRDVRQVQEEPIAVEVEEPRGADDTELSMKQWQQEIHAWAKGKGWWELDATTQRAIVDLIASKLLMIVTEIAEATEELRNGKRSPGELLTQLRTDYFDDTGKPCGFGVELADAAIRLADLAEFVGVDLGVVMRRKMRYNARRPKRHGGKLL